MAHSYVSPEIIYGVSDFVGDSYKLSKDAMTTSAKTIVFAAVRFKIADHDVNALRL